MIWLNLLHPFYSCLLEPLMHLFRVNSTQLQIRHGTNCRGCYNNKCGCHPDLPPPMQILLYRPLVPLTKARSQSRFTDVASESNSRAKVCTRGWFYLYDDSKAVPCIYTEHALPALFRELNNITQWHLCWGRRPAGYQSHPIFDVDRSTGQCHNTAFCEPRQPASMRKVCMYLGDVECD